jgi:hypothetical protein
VYGSRSVAAERRGAGRLTSCAVIDKANRTGLIIEVDESAEEVLRRMVAAGVPIVGRIPET